MIILLIASIIILLLACAYHFEVAVAQEKKIKSLEKQVKNLESLLWGEE